MAEVLDTPVDEPVVSLRDTIEDAVDASEEGIPISRSEPAAPSVDKERSAPVSTEQPKPASVEPVTPAKPVAKSADQPVTPAAPAAPTELKAPSQWKPQVREKWNQLPREVQEEVLRREGDNLRLIGSVGQKIKFADEISQNLQPFAERLQQNGVAPGAFAADVFQTVKSLAHGSMEEKAAVVANIVQSYGIDLRMLDQVLTHRLQTPPPSPEVIQARQLAARAQAVLQQQTQGSEQQASTAAETALAHFSSDPKNEFFDDVRDLMADLIESGRVQTLEEAYGSAVWANPDTRKILLQREAEQRASSRGQRAAKARVASSSVGGTPLQPGGSIPNPKASLRDTIAAAFDAQSTL